MQNMVGPGEVDDDLQPEVAEECSKYGEVVKCLVFEVSIIYYVKVIRNKFKKWTP